MDELFADAPVDIAAFTGRHVAYAAARNVGKGWSFLSDHNPVFVTLEKRK